MKSRDVTTISRRAGADANVRFQAKRMQSSIVPFHDRHQYVARSPSSHDDDHTRNPRPPLTRSGRDHSGRKSRAGPAADPILLFSAPTRAVGGLARWSKLSSGVCYDPSREEREADKLPCPLEGIFTLV